METIIVIPCYNEQYRLDKDAFISFAQKHSEIEFLFVNDGSKDGTLEMLKMFAATNNQFHYFDMPDNSGKAEAVRQGIMYALQNFQFDYIGFWDADLATPLEEIIAFRDFIVTHQYDMITGLRLMRLGAGVKRKYSRHYLGRFFASVAAFVVDLPVYDTQCGAKLYKASVVEVLFKEQFITRWLFDVELLARYISVFGRESAREKIYEYPVMKWMDIAGSRLKLKDFFKAPYELFKISRKYKCRKQKRMNN